jgi:hypothetical protein
MGVVDKCILRTHIPLGKSTTVIKFTLHFPSKFRGCKPKSGHINNDVLTFLKIGIFCCFAVSVFADQQQWLADPLHHCYCWRRRRTYERKILGKRNDHEDGSEKGTKS